MLLFPKLRWPKVAKLEHPRHGSSKSSRIVSNEEALEASISLYNRIKEDKRIKFTNGNIEL